MSDVNKLDNFNKCSFDPEHFKVKVKSIEFYSNVSAPVGTFPWAIIQVYLSKPVGRSTWNANEYLIPKYDDLGNLIYIQQADKDGSFSPWTPEQKDMVACDWNLVSGYLENSMLVLDISIGSAKDAKDKDDKQISIGYGDVSDQWNDMDWTNSFGNLKIIKNKTGIVNITAFYWSVNELVWVVQSNSDESSRQKLDSLFKNKALSIIIDEVYYDLGKRSDSGTPPAYDTYDIDSLYENTEANKLGVMMKQNVGKTLRFYFNWRDS